MNRCRWCNVNNPEYVRYHDEEWGKLRLDDRYLFEMLLLESFQAGLSWECVLNKREAFRSAFDDFDPQKIADYGLETLGALAEDRKIIRNRRKIAAAANNARHFLEIQAEYGSFSEYLRQFWNGKVIRDAQSTTSVLSDAISEDLRRRDMTFVGSTIIHSFLQAVGVVNAHEEDCDWKMI